jgi:transcription antitermination factor NusG
MNWYALYTKPRNEKKVVQRLNQLGVEVYCPLVITTKKWSDRYKKVEVPLLPSYVFVRLNAADRSMVFQVPGIVQYVYWLGAPAIILSKEIEALKKYLENPVIDVQITNLKPNDSMYIQEGPFKGELALVKQVSANKITLILSSLNIHLIIEQ